MNNNTNKPRITEIFANRTRIAGEMSDLTHDEKSEALSLWKTIGEITLTGSSRCGKSQEPTNGTKKHPNKFMIFNDYRSKK